MGGSSNGDYSKQIDTALQQANLPKSPLSQQYSNIFGNISPDLFKALTNVQSLGNSFINSGPSGGTYTPPNVSSSNPFTNFSIPGQTPGDVAKQGWDAVFRSGNSNYIPSNGYTGFANGQSVNGGQPNIPGYTGGFTPSYQNIGGVDLSQYLGKGLKLSDLVKQGVLTQSQVNQQFGVGDNFDPSSDAGIQNDYKNFQSSYLGQQQPNLSLQDWYKQYGYNSTNLDAYTANDPTGLDKAFEQLRKNAQPNNGSVDSNGNYILPDSSQQNAKYLINGRYVDGYGNDIGAGPSSGSGGGSGNGSVGIGPTGLPTGVNIPGVQNSAGINGLSNLSPSILQLLATIGGGPSQVNNQNVNNPGFKQQVLNPGTATSNFTPTQADLSGVASGTQLTPENSQYMDAVSKILNSRFDKNIADTRERALDTGTARSTGASYDEAQLKAAQYPQLVAALNAVRQPEVANQLQSAGLQQQGLLQNAGLQNQYGLGGAQLDTSTQLQNISNLINSGNLNNLTSLQARGQDVGTALANASNNLGAQTSNQSAGLQSQGLNFGLLNQLLGTQLGQQGLVSSNNQYNAGANNAFNLALGGMNQSAAQQSIQNQLQALTTLFGSGLGLASQGIPGGSANVSIGNTGQGNSLGSTLGGLGGLFTGLKALGLFG